MVKERTLALTHTHPFLRPLNNIFLLRRILEGSNELIRYLSSNYFLNGNIVRSITSILIHKIFQGMLKDRAYALDITRPPYNFIPRCHTMCHRQLGIHDRPGISIVQKHNVWDFDRVAIADITTESTPPKAGGYALF